MNTRHLIAITLSLVIVACGGGEKKNGASAGESRLIMPVKSNPTNLDPRVGNDNAKREYAYGPAQGLPDSKVGTFTQALYDEAKKRGWVVISMKDDWKRIFAFEQ